jgi:proline dehydrogenase
MRSVLLSLAQSSTVKDLVTNARLPRSVVARYLAGEGPEEAVATTTTLVQRGLTVTLDHLGEDTTQADQADAATEAYLTLLRRLDAAGLTGAAELSVKLSAVGQALPGDGEKIAYDNAARICAAAAEAGTTVTLDMEDHTTVDSTLTILRELRADYPSAGAVLQSYLRRTEGDCRDLAYDGSRVRLCKGAYQAPASVAFQDRAEVDLSYVRCLKALMAAPGYPMVATHDPRLIEIAGALAVTHQREQGSYEFQLLYGVRPAEQQRLAGEGERVRVYVPYGTEWYGYFMRRLAERPANVAFFLRSLASKR